MTGDDEDNLVACQVAKTKFNVPRAVSRINNPKNEEIFKKLGIDTTVSSTAVILAHIEQELPSHPLIALMTLRGGGLEIVEVKIPRHSGVVGKRIRELLLPQQSLIILTVDEEGTPRIPSDETVVRAGDEVVAVTRRESEDALRAVLTGNGPRRTGRKGKGNERRLAFLGPPGTFTEEAALLYDPAAQLLPFASVPLSLPPSIPAWPTRAWWPSRTASRAPSPIRWTS